MGNSTVAQMDGPFSGCYANGQKRYEGTYKHGKLDGTSTHWYKNGLKRLESTHKDGKLDGLETWWYKNGQKELEWTFQDGVEVPGSRKGWDKNGNIKKLV